MSYIDLKYRRDENKICDNPNKGWYVHFYDNGLFNYGGKLAEDDLLDDFPFMDHIYMRLAWAYLEPEEGKFNWDLIDRVINRFEGKYRFAFRVTCKETDDTLPYATPKWVEDAGAKGNFVNGYYEPEYGDEIFLSKLNNFHRAFAERYDSRDDVIYIDIGSYGDWGEGHCCCSSKKDWPFEVLKKHIDIHLNNYKTQLAVSDDIIGSRVDTACNDQLLNYIISNKITIRDDGVSVKYFADTYGFDSLRSGEIFDRAWRHFPTILELEHYGTAKKTNSYNEGWPFLASCEGAHATYAGFHGFPREWFNENKELAVTMGNKLGYWYCINGIQIDETINSGAFDIKCFWENIGSAPAYNKFELTFKLRSENNEYFCKADSFDNTRFMPHTVTVDKYTLDFGEVESGAYTLSANMTFEGKLIRLAVSDEYTDNEGFINLCEIKIM